MNEVEKTVTDTIPIEFNEKQCKRKLVPKVSLVALVLGTRSVVACLFLNIKQNEPRSPTRML